MHLPGIHNCPKISHAGIDNGVLNVISVSLVRKVTQPPNSNIIHSRNDYSQTINRKLHVMLQEVQSSHTHSRFPWHTHKHSHQRSLKFPPVQSTERLPEIIFDREVSIQIQHHQQDEVGCEGAVEHQQVLAVLWNDNGTGGSFGHCEQVKIPKYHRFPSKFDHNRDARHKFGNGMFPARTKKCNFLPPVHLPAYCVWRVALRSVCSPLRKQQQ